MSAFCRWLIRPACYNPAASIEGLKRGGSYECRRSAARRRDVFMARRADGQEVFIDASVIFAIDPAEIVNVHIRWQGRYIDELIRPQARGIIRDAASRYRVEEIVTSQRDAFKEQIQQ